MTNFTPRSGEGGWGAARADLWSIQRETGDPARLLAGQIPLRRNVRVLRPDRRALVTGSGRAVEGALRRPSGGSAVLVAPDVLAWIDVVIPADDPLWRADVGVAPLWLGEVWAAALEGLGVACPRVHSGAMMRTEWSDAWCFAGVGAGEVLVDERKVVGVSQRRTRAAVLFQCGALLRWEPPLPELSHVAVGVVELLGRPITVDAVEQAFLTRLRGI